MTDASEMSQDRLTALPSELLHHIFAYLFPTHIEDKALLHPADLARRQGGPCSHALDHLAATCKTLRLEVNEWAHHFLVQYRHITNFTEPKRPATTAKGRNVIFCTNYLRNRSNASKALLTWSDRRCVFCGKPCSRPATMMNGLKCCNPCDKKEWPNKITKTQALAEFDLKKRFLLPHHELGGLASNDAFNALGISRLRYGTYFSVNVPTTMFLRKDVEKLANIIHGNVNLHMMERARALEERKKKIEENRPFRKAKAQAKAAKAVEEARKRAAQAAIERSSAVTNTWSGTSEDGNQNESDVRDRSSEPVVIE